MHYSQSDQEITYWRTQSKLEVDFIVGNNLAIEVKGSGRVSASSLKDLRALRDEMPTIKLIVVCTEPIARTTEDDIDIIPLKDFCKNLWQGKYKAAHPA